MKRTTEQTKSASATTATRVLRRAHSAAVVSQPRFELSYDRESQSYVLGLV